MSRPTPLSIPDQRAKRIVITGANSGLGLVVARRFAKAGAHVIMAARSPEKNAEAAASIRQANPEASLQLESLDLADLTSVRRFAEALLTDDGRVDVLLNNAGIMAVPKRHTTAEGFELQFGTNHLGHFALTAHLLPALRRTTAPRVVTMSSVLHWTGRMRFADLNSEKRYNPWLAYGQSKLANLLFMHELQRRSDESGWGILSAAAHPGSSRTNLQSAGPGLGRDKPSRGVRERIFTLPGISQSAEDGAEPALFTASWASVHGGDYIGPANFLTGPPSRARESRHARDAAAAVRLWEASEALTGVTFP